VKTALVRKESQDEGVENTSRPSKTQKHQEQGLKNLTFAGKKEDRKKRESWDKEGPSAKPIVDRLGIKEVGALIRDENMKESRSC